MYKIYADDVLIYDSALEEYKIGKGAVSLEVNKSGSFEFSLYPDHPFYDEFIRLKTAIAVYKDDRIVFRGRVLSDVTDHWNNKVLTCEGELGFLQDSIIRPFTFSGTPAELFTQLIEAHNEQVDEFKRFNIGEVTVAADVIAHDSTEYDTAFNMLTNALLEGTPGGYLHITHDTDDAIPTIHYLADFTETASQTIEFGANLKQYTKTVRAEDIATAIIPLGARPETEGKEKDDTPLTIAAINDGLDYVYSEEGVEAYGWIFKTVEWDDITNAKALKARAEEYLANVVNQTITIELNAVDLHLLDRSVESFNVCEYVSVRSEPHNFDATLLCQKQTLDLLDPGNDTVVLGATYSRFTEKNNKTTATIKKMSTQFIQNLTVVNETINQTVNTVEKISVQLDESSEKDLEPEIYRVYGKVNELSVNLIQKDDGLAHEYTFEFIPAETFTGLTITPEVIWANTPSFPSGKVCQVSILRGVAILIYA